MVPIETAPNLTFAHAGIGIIGCITYRDSIGKTRHNRMHYKAIYSPEQPHHTVYADPLFVYYEILEFKLVDSEAD